MDEAGVTTPRNSPNLWAFLRTTPSSNDDLRHAVPTRRMHSRGGWEVERPAKKRDLPSRFRFFCGARRVWFGKPRAARRCAHADSRRNHGDEEGGCGRWGQEVDEQERPDPGDRRD